MHNSMLHTLYSILVPHRAASKEASDLAAILDPFKTSVMLTLGISATSNVLLINCLVQSYELSKNIADAMDASEDAAPSNLTLLYAPIQERDHAISLL